MKARLDSALKGGRRPAVFSALLVSVLLIAVEAQAQETAAEAQAQETAAEAQAQETTAEAQAQEIGVEATVAPANGGAAAPLEQASQDNSKRDLSSWLPEIHGFVSQGFLKSSKNNYLAQSERGSFEFNEVGINFTEKFGDRLRVGMQLFMRDLGPIGNYKPQFDWFYIDYRLFDWLGVRAGRTKIPFGLYNEVNDIDAAREPILLPQSVYPTRSRDYLLAQTGFEVYGRTPYSALGSLEYRFYGGTIYLDTSSSTTVDNFDVPYVVGGRLMWELPVDGLRMGGTFQAMSLDGDLVLDAQSLKKYKESGDLPEGASDHVPFRIPVQLWVASLEYSAHDWLFAAEYGRWHVKIESDAPAVIPPKRTESERMYVMASHQVTPWFAPGAYYALWFPDVKDRSSASDKYQHDVALTLRFDPIENLLFKLEGHYMNGTANLDDSLNNGTPPSQLAKDWLLFLFKTTAYF